MPSGIHRDHLDEDQHRTDELKGGAACIRSRSCKKSGTSDDGLTPQSDAERRAAVIDISSDVLAQGGRAASLRAGMSDLDR